MFRGCLRSPTSIREPTLRDLVFVGFHRGTQLKQDRGAKMGAGCEGSSPQCSIPTAVKQAQLGGRTRDLPGRSPPRAKGCWSGHPMILILAQPFDWIAPPGFGARDSCRVAVDCQLYPTDHGMPSPGRSAQINTRKEDKLGAQTVQCLCPVFAIAKAGGDL